MKTPIFFNRATADDADRAAAVCRSIASQMRDEPAFNVGEPTEAERVVVARWEAVYGGGAPR
jgi:hypothetical protein